MLFGLFHDKSLHVGSQLIPMFPGFAAQGLISQTTSCSTMYSLRSFTAIVVPDEEAVHELQVEKF